MRRKIVGLCLAVSWVAGQPLMAGAHPPDNGREASEYGPGTQVAQAPVPPSEQQICESGHRLEDVYDNGRLIELEDGSLWEINVPDQADTMFWSASAEITVCPGKLVNTDEDEAAGARRFNQPEPSR
jgi:hypothetical protein